MSPISGEWPLFTRRSRRRAALLYGLTAALLVVAPVHVGAQDGCSNGGSDPNWANLLRRHARKVFTNADSSYVDYRQRHDIVVPDTTKGRLITDHATCSMLRPAVKKAVGTLSDAPPPLSSFDLVHFQFGNYYAVLLAPAGGPNASTSNRGYQTLLIFRVGTLEYIGFVLV